MPRNTKDVPIREKHTRIAKDKATLQIAKYFKPKKALQIIPENDEIKFQKTTVKDKNNNNKNTGKRQLEDLEHSDINNFQKKQTQHNDKVAFGDAKRKKVSETESISNASTSSTSTSDNIIVVLDTSIDSNNSVLVDSSVSSSVNGRSKIYNFDMLHTDDPTDSDEDDRNAPYWSLYRNRIAIVTDQTAVKLSTIDEFFGCKFENVDSRDIFPTMVQIKRRRSTAVWSTPPRYSMLPKY